MLWIREEKLIIKSSESNRRKFERIAESRTNAVLDKIRVLSNCSNPHTYDYTEADVVEIFAAIETAVKRAKVKFQNGDDREMASFHLSSGGHRAGELENS